MGQVESTELVIDQQSEAFIKIFLITHNITNINKKELFFNQNPAVWGDLLCFCYQYKIFQEAAQDSLTKETIKCIEHYAKYIIEPKIWPLLQQEKRKVKDAHPDVYFDFDFEGEQNLALVEYANTNPDDFEIAEALVDNHCFELMPELDEHGKMVIHTYFTCSELEQAKTTEYNITNKELKEVHMGNPFILFLGCAQTQKSILRHRICTSDPDKNRHSCILLLAAHIYYLKKSNKENLFKKYKQIVGSSFSID